MGQIVASYDLMPENTEIDLDAIVAKLSGILPAGVKLIETSIAPVAFGLKKVVAGFVIEDANENVGTELEDALRSIPGIENIECVSSTVL